MKRIFACVLGLNPQILIENLQVIYTDYQVNSHPDKIYIFTSIEGNQKFNEYLEAIYKVEIDKKCLLPNNILTLIKTAEVMISSDDVDAIGNNILKFLDLVYSNNPEEVHLSIAGGRKYTTAMMAMAFSLFANENDKLSHVIASSEIENMGIDYFLHKKLEFHHIKLIEIPFIRLGSYRPSGCGDWASLIEVFQDKIGKTRIIFDTDKMSLQVNGSVLILQPMVGAFFLCICEMTKLGKGIGRTTLTSEDLRKNYLKLGYKKIMPQWQKYISPTRVEEMVSRINKLVRDSTKQKDRLRFIISDGGWAKTKYFINIEKFDIDIIW